MKFDPKRSTLAESEIEKRVEKKMQEITKRWEGYDEMMTRFMSGLIEKSKESPELSKVIREIANTSMRYVKKQSKD